MHRHFLGLRNKIRVKPGKPEPFGATILSNGVQFSIFSRHATAVDLLLFNKAEDVHPAKRIRFNPKENKTGDCWHIIVEGLKKGQLYLYQIDGPYAPLEGHRFNKNRFLLDPYAKAITGEQPWNLRNTFGYNPEDINMDLSFSKSNVSNGIPKCVVIDDAFDWQGDKPLNYPLRQTILYETHLKSLSSHPETIARYGIKNPGTYSAVVDMIPHFKELGISSVELLPLAEFDEDEHAYQKLNGRPKKNYWGYSTIAFFAPKGGYAVSFNGQEQVNEFKMMVRELHKAGLEVILDVVFNHTGEGNQMGPTFSFRGIDNSIYYTLDDNKRLYANFSGCGNTVNCNHPVVRTLILDCLRYWVLQMHVDGFRFDLASVLGRDEQGGILENPPIIERIAEDPILRNTKIIAEAWDAGGAYQVGSFPGTRWAEWNDKFRDEVRSFWRGDSGKVGSFATRISGSSDVYIHTGRKPYHSINFITAHDGFTLKDLVCYNEKHNLDNGEKNNDGTDNNLSFNWGVEGETDDDLILSIRSRIMKNFWATLLLSSGTPMILGGDELQNTQKGNNNAYCQDNEISWHDFSRIEEYSDFFRFARLVIAFRKNHPALQRREFFSGQDSTGNQNQDIYWFNEEGSPIDWNRQENILALRINGDKEKIHHHQDDSDIIMLFNSSGNNVHFHIPSPPENARWFRVLDTSMKSPQDILEPGNEIALDREEGYSLEHRAMAVFISLRQ